MLILILMLMLMLMLTLMLMLMLPLRQLSQLPRRRSPLLLGRCDNRGHRRCSRLDRWRLRPVYRLWTP